MDLIYKLETLDNVAEEHKGLYKEVDGSFVLGVSGVKDITEFNTVHTALGKERDEHKATKKKLKGYGDNTPDTFIELNNQIADLKLYKSSNSTEEIEKRLQEALTIKLTPHEQKKLEDAETISELQKTISSMNTEKETSKLKDWITKKVNASDSSVKPESYNDIYARARLHDLKYNSDVKDFVDNDGNTIDSWFETQAKNSTWNKSSAGAGASGGSSGSDELTNKQSKYKKLMAKETLTPIEEVEVFKLAKEIKEKE